MEKEALKQARAFFFDFEGTLVDFQWNLSGAVRDTLKRLQSLGFPVDRLQGKKYSLLKNEAMTIAPEIKQPPAQVGKEIDAIYDRFDEDALTRWNLRPNTKEVLTFLKTHGIKAGLVSNVGRRALEGAIKKLGLASFFDVIMTRNDVQQLKPSGEGIRLALRCLEIPKEEVLFVGDSIDDIQAAKDAGLRVIIILGGENPGSELLSSGPDFLIQDFSELIEWLKEKFT